jgi:predicted dehydrogenase
VGVGFGAGVHLPAFKALDGVDVVGIAHSGAGQHAVSQQHGTLVYPDWRVMLAELRPDSVSIAVPPDAQRGVVESALRQGAHVLCEKPMGLCADDAIAMCDQAVSSTAIGAVALQYRFEPRMSEFRKQIMAGTVGRIRRIDFAWITEGRASPQRPWAWQHDVARGGGVINGFMPHVIDLLRYLSGFEIARVTAQTAVLIPERPDAAAASRIVTAEDAVDGWFELESGAIASVRVTNCQVGGEGMQIDVHGDHGILRYAHRPPYSGEVMISCSPAIPGAQIQSRDIGSQVRQEGDARTQAFRSLVKLFVDAVRGLPTPDLPTFRDGMRVQQVLEAMRTSAREARSVAVT